MCKHYSKIKRRLLFVCVFCFFPFFVKSFSFCILLYIVTTICGEWKLINYSVELHSSKQCFSHAHGTHTRKKLFFVRGQQAMTSKQHLNVEVLVCMTTHWFACDVEMFLDDQDEVASTVGDLFNWPLTCAVISTHLPGTDCTWLLAWWTLPIDVWRLSFSANNRICGRVGVANVAEFGSDRQSKAAYTRYNRLYNRLYNGLYNHLSKSF